MINKLSIALLFIITFTFFLLGCSSSNPVIRPDNTPNESTSLEREDQESPPMAHVAPPMGDYIIRQVLTIPVEAFYSCNGKVPFNFTELCESGLLLGIPKAPYADLQYGESSDITVENLGEFSYRSNNDKSFSYSFVEMVDGSPEVINVNRDDSYWSSKLISEEKRKAYCDAKIESMMEFFASAFYLYYLDYKALPTSPKELFADYELISEAWSNKYVPDDVYFEFGVDDTHETIYAKYKYTHGFKKIYAQKISMWEYSNLDDDEFFDFVSILDFDETPDPNELILNPWFTFGNLASVYEDITE